MRIPIVSWDYTKRHTLLVSCGLHTCRSPRRERKKHMGISTRVNSVVWRAAVLGQWAWLVVGRLGNYWNSLYSCQVTAYATCACCVLSLIPLSYTISAVVMVGEMHTSFGCNPSLLLLSQQQLISQSSHALTPKSTRCPPLPKSIQNTRSPIFRPRPRPQNAGRHIVVESAIADLSVLSRQRF